MIEKMLICLKLPTPAEQELIIKLFFKDKSERQMSRETGTHYMTIHDRKIRILVRLNMKKEESQWKNKKSMSY